MMNPIKLTSMLEHFYNEDIGEGDLSSFTLFPAEAVGEMTIVSKMHGIFAGKAVIETAMRMLDPSTKVECFIEDGAALAEGTVIAIVKGSIRSLLTSERVMLNLLQRMCGIATATNEVVKLVEGTATRICDTRKTAPGLRMLDKYAVRMGGGFNHRTGLYDAVMLKDNHIALAGSIKKAVQTVRASIGHTTKIEVEIETLEQLQEAIVAKADIIMFDNCTPEQIKSWISLVPNTIITEASGMITKENIRSYAETGVDYISLGSLTHSVKALDISAIVKMTA